MKIIELIIRITGLYLMYLVDWKVAVGVSIFALAEYMEITGYINERND